MKKMIPDMMPSIKDPAAKNQAVSFGAPVPGVNAIKQKTLMTQGINRTKPNL